jgi:hypothetical protein
MRKRRAEMSDSDARIADLERRVQLLEDHIALYQALTTYGPSVDSMEVDEALQLWTEDGVYDLGDGFPALEDGEGALYLNGREEIRQMLEGPLHAGGFVKQGCAHIMSVPLLKIEGDRAIGIGYHRLHAHGDDGARVARLTASRWEWQRQESGGWKAVLRTHRLLDGREAGRTLLRETLKEINPGSRNHEANTNPT